MQSASDEITKPAAKQYTSMVAASMRKDVSLDGITYQTGIRSALLWPNKLQCLRIIPGYDESTGEICRQLKPGKPFTREYDPCEYLSESFFCLRTIAGLGEDRHTVITSYRPGSPEAQRWAGNTVIHWFSADIARAVNAARDGKNFHLTPSPEWAKWTSYDQIGKKMPVLPFDRETLMFQALVYTLNGRPNTIKTDSGYQPLVDEAGNALPVVYLCGIDNSNSMKELYKALIEPADPTKPLDGLNNNIYKGIAEQDGSILYLLPGKIMQKDKQQNVLQPHVSEDPADWSNTPYPLSSEQIYSWWKPWDKLLNFMTPDEQCELLASQFGADTVNYVIGNCAALKGLVIPESVARVGLGRYAAHQNKQATGAPSGFGSITPTPVKATQVSVKPTIASPAPSQAKPQQPRTTFGSVGLKSESPNVKAELAKMQAAGVKTGAGGIDAMASLAQDLIGDVDFSEDNPLL